MSKPYKEYFQLAAAHLVVQASLYVAMYQVNLEVKNLFALLSKLFSSSIFVNETFLKYAIPVTAFVLTQYMLSKPSKNKQAFAREL